MKNYNTYLFDADGTLFDTADLVYGCFQYVAQKYGSIALSREAVLAGYGLPLKGQLIKRLGNDVDIDVVLDDFIQHQMQILEDSIAVFPGVGNTLARLKQAGKKLAIVTSRKSYSMGRILEITDLAKYFDTVITPEDTKRHKPDPEPVLLALSRLEAKKSETVFIGDAQYDILSGSSAGIDTVFVNWSHMDFASLPIHPTHRIGRMEDLTSGF